MSTPQQCPYCNKYHEVCFNLFDSVDRTIIDVLLQNREQLIEEIKEKRDEQEKKVRAANPQCAGWVKALDWVLERLGGDED